MANNSSNATRRMPQGHGPHAATHPRWELRRDALIRADGQPMAANLVPFADEMRKFLQQKGHLSVVTETTRQHPLSFTNPYTYHAATIEAGLSATINAAFDFCESIEPMDVSTPALLWRRTPLRCVSNTVRGRVQRPIGMPYYRAVADEPLVRNIPLEIKVIFIDPEDIRSDRTPFRHMYTTYCTRLS